MPRSAPSRNPATNSNAMPRSASSSIPAPITMLAPTTDRTEYAPTPLTNPHDIDMSWPGYLSGVFGAARQYNYNRETFIAAAAELRGKSPHTIEDEFRIVWGGVSQFLDHARDVNGEVQGCPEISATPMPNQAIYCAALFDNLYLRIWGFEDVLKSGVFCFSFGNSNGEHVAKPRNVRVVSVSMTAYDVEVLSVRESFEKALPNLMLKVGDSDSDPEVFLTIPSMELRIDRGSDSVYIKIPDAPLQATPRQTATFTPFRGTAPAGIFF